jgi:hypothetical protein
MTGSATWAASPATNSFNDPGNWSTGSVPTGTATFDASSTTTIAVSSLATLTERQFAGALAYPSTSPPT